MPERDWSKIGWAVVWLSWALLLGWHSIEQWADHRALIRDGVIAEGTVSYSEPPKRGSDPEAPITDYEFSVNGKKYEGGGLIYIPAGEKLKVRYLSFDPSINMPDGYGGDYVQSVFFALLMLGAAYYVGSLGYSEKTLKRVADDLSFRLTPTPFVLFPIVLLSMASATMLFLAIFPQPYFFFQVLRWLVMGTAAMLCYFSYHWEFKWAPWVFGALAILFNPVVPFHLSRSAWHPIDLVTAVIFAVSAWNIFPSQKVSENH